MHLNLMLRAGVIALVVTLAAIFSLPAKADSKNRQPGTLSITGTGMVNAAPDMAVVTSGVITEAKTAREALDANTARMQQVIAILKEAGIEARDIATTGFNVNPVYTRYRPNPGEEARPPTIQGYRVANNVTVRVRDLSNLGAVLDRVVSDGANSIGGIRFAIDNNEELMDKARAEAVTDAVRKAKILAEAAGIELGRILSLTEGHVARPPVPVMQMARADAVMAEPVPIEAGEQTLSVTVSITWELAE